MKYVSLKANGGQYIGVREDEKLVAVRTTVTPAEIFEWVPVGDQNVALRSVLTGKYVCAEGGGGQSLLVNRTTRDASETFGFSRSGSTYTLTAHGGQFVSAEGGGGRELVANRTAVGPWEQFQVEAKDELLSEAQSMRCCCGLPDHHQHSPIAAATFEVREVKELKWNKETHAQIVNNAFSLATRYDTLDGAATLKKLWANETFKSAVHSGLVDADEYGKVEYTGFLYAKHFYDPDTRTNYFGFTSGTAMTEALTYFRESTNQLATALPVLNRGESLSEALARDMGYKLGLALHYLTDLTQPMHAANFANVFASAQLHDWRHSGFEEYAETNRSRFVGNLSTVQAREIDPKVLGFGSPADLLQRVAANAKRIFIEKVGPAAAAKLQWVSTPEGGPVAVITNKWGSEADAALQEALPYGQNMTAAFLLYWAAYSVTALVHRIYQRVLEREADPEGIRFWGEKLRSGVSVRQVIRQIAKCDEYWDRFMKMGGETAVRYMYRHFLAREPESQFVINDWAGWMNKAKWHAAVDYFVDSQEYVGRFGDSNVPG